MVLPEKETVTADHWWHLKVFSFDGRTTFGRVDVAGIMWPMSVCWECMGSLGLLKHNRLRLD